RELDVDALGRNAQQARERGTKRGRKMRDLLRLESADVFELRVAGWIGASCEEQVWPLGQADHDVRFRLTERFCEKARKLVHELDLRERLRERRGREHG